MNIRPVGPTPVANGIQAPGAAGGQANIARGDHVTLSGGSEPVDSARERSGFDENVWCREAARFSAMLPELLKLHPNRGIFVALVDGKVIDNDSDAHALARRVAAAHGGTVFIGEVVEETPAYELSSPEEA